MGSVGCATAESSRIKAPGPTLEAFGRMRTRAVQTGTTGQALRDGGPGCVQSVYCRDNAVFCLKSLHNYHYGTFKSAPGEPALCPIPQTIPCRQRPRRVWTKAKIAVPQAIAKTDKTQVRCSTTIFPGFRWFSPLLLCQPLCGGTQPCCRTHAL